jgi:hypothetical protein
MVDRQISKEADSGHLLQTVSFAEVDDQADHADKRCWKK